MSHHDDECGADCAEFLADVWKFLDHECDPERREALQRHLDECSPCLELYGLEEHLKALLARKCGGDHAPDGLRQRLRTTLREVVLEQTEVTVERDDTGSVTATAQPPTQSSSGAQSGSGRSDSS